jgi:hypothetical protein
MTPLPLKVRFIHVVAYRIWERDAQPCEHQHDFKDHTEWNESVMNGPHKCDKCGGDFEMRSGYPLYNTESGRPEPGDIFYENWLDENFYWDNHKGPHLMAICPNGMRWCIDSRASNCTMPEDRLHRCWVRHGDPEKGEIHVDKQGVTCEAGAGSIAIGENENHYHGMLHNSQFT